MKFGEFRKLVSDSVSDRDAGDAYVQVVMQASFKLGADVEGDLREAAARLNDERAVREAMTERFERFENDRAMMHTGMQPEADRNARGATRDEPESDHTLHRRATNAHSTMYQRFREMSVRR